MEQKGSGRNRHASVECTDLCRHHIQGGRRMSTDLAHYYNARWSVPTRFGAGFANIDDPGFTKALSVISKIAANRPEASLAKDILDKMYVGHAFDYDVYLTDDDEIAIEVSKDDVAVSVELHPAGSARCKAVSRHEMRHAWYSHAEHVNGPFLTDALHRVRHQFGFQSFLRREVGIGVYPDAMVVYPAAIVTNDSRIDVPLQPYLLPDEKLPLFVSSGDEHE